MADRDNYRGYGSPSGRYYEGREYDRGYSNDRNRRDERSWFGNDRDDDRASRDRSRDDGRGFFERAGEEVRSWFGGDDDRGGDRNRDHDRDEWRSQSPDRGRERNRGYGCGAMMSGQGGRDRQDSREPWGGGDREQRYGSGGDETGQSRYGGSGGYQGGRFQDRGGYGGGHGGTGSGDYDRNRSGSHPHDAHYGEWRQQQLDAFDRDYEDYRRENRDKFHNEFSSWRNNRQQQRSSMQNVREHMDVVGSDGEHVGTVDKVAGDRIILTKSDASAGGHHHSIPCSWIQSVDDKVTINKSAQQARQQWQDEENRRALFENNDQHRGEGAHMLNRSFSGTYEDR